MLPPHILTAGVFNANKTKMESVLAGLTQVAASRFEDSTEFIVNGSSAGIPTDIGFGN
jgi:hypothetical protein